MLKVRKKEILLKLKIEQLFFKIEKFYMQNLFSYKKSMFILKGLLKKSIIKYIKFQFGIVDKCKKKFTRD